RLVDLHHVEVSDGDALGAVAAGHADALLGPAAAAVGGVGRHRAALPRPLLDAVTLPQAAEPVPLDDPRGAAPLRRADHIDGLDVLEHLGDRQSVADLDLGRGGQAEFAQVTLGLAVRLGWRGDAGADAGLAALGHQVLCYMAALRADCLAAGLVAEPELH